jgi:hypothetical protein
MAEVREDVATEATSKRQLLVSRLGEAQRTIGGTARRVRDNGATSLRSRSFGWRSRGDESAEAVEDGPFPEGVPIDNETWTLVVTIATYELARDVAECTGGTRGEKMDRVVTRLSDGLAGLFDEGGADLDDMDEVLAAMVETWSEADRIRLLIDLDFSDPFFPYSLKFNEGDFETALRRIALLLGFGRDVIGEIRDTRRSAARSHQSVSWMKIGVFGAGGVLLLGTGAFVMAPVVGAALGSAAGYSGAAATSWGLALLGGGSLASGGAGMAGGMWLVTSAGAVAGLVGGSGSAALYEMGARQARIEITRLQVTFKMTILSGQVDTLKAQAVIESLNAQLDELQATLAEERELNDANSDRIKDLETKVKAIEDGLGWMQRQEADQDA